MKVSKKPFKRLVKKAQQTTSYNTEENMLHLVRNREKERERKRKKEKERERKRKKGKERESHFHCYLFNAREIWSSDLVWSDQHSLALNK